MIEIYKSKEIFHVYCFSQSLSLLLEQLIVQTGKDVPMSIIFTLFKLHLMATCSTFNCLYTIGCIYIAYSIQVRWHRSNSST